MQNVDWLTLRAEERQLAFQSKFHILSPYLNERDGNGKAQERVFNILIQI